ncbi:hypothetical protein C2E20_4310 [Micractinium conductrix]|uniref:Uncharacterized protein n=1 Tax=Micractinium conductrix TaxID=554055 RepID=A0A2P6VER0_9CHLO|nr:hypothetical protein C2E20_4310 [Micractinium conductrix]|eukprot:PSC72568.1 hypothetical protein C2E20_4310 [Micractinium conductrix]
MACTIASRASQSLWRAPGRSGSRTGRRCAVRVAATSWDPEGLFKGGPQEGLIERKMFFQQVQGDKQFAIKMEEFAAKEAEELQKKRDARQVPEAIEDLVEFFLDTEATEMEFEVARCRPRLTPDFFAHLDKRVGLERFSPIPDEDKLAELETLRDYLNEAVEAVEKAAATLAAPQDRLKKLLEAKDKKAVLLEMAAANEIDRAMIDLLDQNIEGATAAKQDQAAEFMRKVKQAALRYLV